MYGGCFDLDPAKNRSIVEAQQMKDCSGCAPLIMVVIASRQDFYDAMPLLALPLAYKAQRTELCLWIFKSYLTTMLSSSVYRPSMFGYDLHKCFKGVDDILRGRAGLPEDPDGWWRKNCAIVTHPVTIGGGVLMARHSRNGKWYPVYGSVDMPHLWKACAGALRSFARTVGWA